MQAKRIGKWLSSSVLNLQLKDKKRQMKDLMIKNNRKKQESSKRQFVRIRRSRLGVRPE